MPVVKGSGLPDNRGARDALHHRDRLKKEIREYLNEKIGEEDIIEAGASKKIKVPVKSMKRYQFIHDRGETGGVGQGDGEVGDVLAKPLEGEKPSEAGTNPGEQMIEIWLDMEEVEQILFESLALPRLKPKKLTEAQTEEIKFDDIAKKGPQLDKKSTLRNNLLRNAQQGEAKLSGIEKDDLRYLSYREVPKPKSKAAVFLLMDVSGSMGPHEKKIARLFFYWTVSFLRYKYNQVEVIFIAHHTEAQEVTEHEFFNRKESGGTMVSSAYKLAQKIQKDRYPESDYNIYCLHASDGDNFGTDNPEVISTVRELTRICSLVGYLEIDNLPSGGMFGGASRGKLGDLFTKHKDELEGFIWAEAEEPKEIWPALKKFFKAEAEEAVR